MQRLLVAAVLAALLLLPGAASASSSGVVVSQVYGGGGNSGATFRNDYVELFNAGSATVDLSGWTVQYATSAGTSWQTTPLTGTVAAGHYYLVQLAGGTVGAALPAADATGTSNIAATSGKIALVRGTAALSCGASAGSCSGAPLLEDLVGYGDASDFEGTGSAAAPSNTLAATRAGGGCTDSGDNAADFDAATPDPRSSATAAHACGGTQSSGPTGTTQVDVDVASVLAVSLDRATLSFGTAAAGSTPTPLPENVTVSSNNAAGYTLSVARTSFSPRDLPLAIAGGSGALVPIPVSPATPLTIGSKDAASAAGGDLWSTRIGFSAPLPLVPTGHYSSTVTYSVVAR
jgi:hypothetical protein